MRIKIFTVKIISSVFVFFLACQVSFGKAVDVPTATTVAYGFCKSEGMAVKSASDLSLIYTASSVINGASVNDFYVFATGATGFVIIAGDDNVVPVLGFSAESPFATSHMPSQVSYWLNNYKDQVNYIIENGITAPAQTAKWNDLLTNTGKTAAKTTIVMPLLHTDWNQSPYYNALCPWDASADTNAVTGCVATAMAQVMKYWNWPVKGVGSHSYYSGAYGMLSAEFDSTTYQWSAMTNTVAHVDTAVAVLMYQAGVSVDMNYSPTESGAFVTTASSPVTNCAQYALQTYFRYKASTLQGLDHYSYDDSSWVDTLKAEIDAHRPVIYTGSGPSGGHCFVADGYTTLNRIHINWGWGGYCNGFYTVEALTPGTESFNDNQTLLIGIEPDTVSDHVDTTVTPVITGITQVNTANSINIYPNPATESVNIDMAGIKASRISITDMQGRELKSVVPATGVTNIAVSDLSAGIYFVRIQSVQGILTRKIVVAR